MTHSNLIVRILPATFFIFVASQVTGCSEEVYGPTGDDHNSTTVLRTPPDAALQVDGYVSFEDGTHQQDLDKYVRAYYQAGGGVPGSADEIDVPGGHYGCSGNNSDWPTGWYYLETDVIYRNGNTYMGARWVYHIYQTPTRNKDITLIAF